MLSRLLLHKPNGQNEMWFSFQCEKAEIILQVAKELKKKKGMVQCVVRVPVTLNAKFL